LRDLLVMTVKLTSLFIASFREQCFFKNTRIPEAYKLSSVLQCPEINMTHLKYF